MKKLFITGLVLLVVGLGGLLLTGFRNETKTFTEEKIIDTNGINTLDVKVDVGEINIIESVREDIFVQYEGNVPANRFQFAVERNGDQVEIVVREKHIFYLIPHINFHKKQTLTVEIPKTGLGKVSVDGDAASVNVDAEHAKEFNITTDTGKITVHKFDGDYMKVRSDVGAVVVKDASGELDILTDSGKIEISLKEINKDIHLESDVGSIHVDMKKVPESFVFDVDSEVGNVKVNGLEGFEKVERSSFRYQKGEKGPVLRARTDVGSITINAMRN